MHFISHLNLNHLNIAMPRQVTSVSDGSASKTPLREHISFYHLPRAANANFFSGNGGEAFLVRKIVSGSFLLQESGWKFKCLEKGQN